MRNPSYANRNARPNPVQIAALKRRDGGSARREVEHQLCLGVGAREGCASHHVAALVFRPHLEERSNRTRMRR